MRNITFSTCSYIKDISGVRGRMVRSAINSWAEMLQLPFAEKIFLDDQSPNSAALSLLDACSMRGKFSRVLYHDIKHPPHSNFGIVASMRLATTPFILHLDDDVFATGTLDEFRSFIELAAGLMEDDSSILGCNMLTVDKHIHGTEWQPGKIYDRFPAWSHPQKYFGTGACLVRRELLQRVTFEQLMAWGAAQPATWEQLVTKSPAEFLTGPLKTPFGSRDAAFLYSATANASLRQYLNHESRLVISRSKETAKRILPSPLLAICRAIRRKKLE
jgi:hypothetical protein